MAEAGTSRLISASAVMAAGTMVSRVLGFGRLMLLVFLFGSGTPQADMFTIANTVPNSMYILLAGGVLNTVLVPQLVRALKNDPDRGEAYTNRIMTVGLLALGLITVALTLAVPWIIDLYANARWNEPARRAQYASMVTLGYYCMPQVFFYGVHVLAGQVLNARDRFGPMMWAPIANNVLSIGVLGLFYAVFGLTDPYRPFTDSEELLLGLGATAGIVAQAAVLVPFLRAAGYRFRPRLDLRGVGLGHTFALAKWTLGFVAVTQLALVVVSNLASGATIADPGSGPDGNPGAGLTSYYNAYAVWILPHSLITVSLATAMLPSASRLAAAGDLTGVAGETTRAIRLAMTALLPAAVGLLVLGLPVARLAFGFGRGARDADFVGWALMALAVGLVPFTVQYLCLRAYYALEDTRTPFLLQILISGANVVLGVAAVLLVDDRRLVATALAAAYSLAYLLGVVVSLARLRRRLPDLDTRSLVGHGGRLLVAVAPAAALAWLVCELLTGGLGGDGPGGGPDGSRWLLAAALALAGLVAVGTFGLAARLLRIREVADILSTVRRRNRTADTPTGVSDRSHDGDSDTVIRPATSTIGEATTAATAVEQPSGPSENAELMAQASIVRNPSEDDTERTLATPVVPAASHPAPPEPGADEPPAPAAALPTGTVLGSRYRVEELLAESAPSVTWRAFDQVLSRSVLVHLLAPGDPLAEDLLAAARKASVATDSRFLRVLDAVHSDDPAIGSYIVCEYATGQSLELILSQGSLSGLEAAWVVREVADALAGVHSLGLYHRRLAPDTVIITPSGNVKIVGLLIESVLRPARADTVPGADQAELVDVLDLGRLLYAALVSRWPAGPSAPVRGRASQLPEAPAIGRRWLAPRQIRAGVPPALDQLCDQILGDPPRHRATPLTTAHAVVNALTKVLGSADASADLERRVRQPVPRVEVSTPRVPRPGPAPVSALLEQPTEAMYAVRPQTLPTGDPVPGPSISAPSIPAPSISAQSISAQSSPAQSAAAQVGVPAPARTASTTAAGDTVVRRAARARTGGARPAGTRPARRWVPLLVVLALLLVTLGLVAGLALSGRLPVGTGPAATRPQPSSAPATTPALEPGPVAVTAARDFDPQGDNREENRDEVPLAYDGNAETRWRTLEYRGNPRLGGIKRGVGLVLDLGTAQPVRTVQVALSGQGTTVELRVPEGDAATVTAPTLTSDGAWRPVATVADAGAAATLTPAEPVTTRFVLVYLTALPREGSGYRGGIFEVEVSR